MAGEEETEFLGGKKWRNGVKGRMAEAGEEEV
jgi:hypothetical protein